MVNIVNTTVPSSKVITLDKETVNYLLSLNTNNRAVRRGKVEEFKKIIADGNWKVMSMHLSKDDNFLDGQHRLLAIKESGYPAGLKVSLVTGVDEETQLHIDRHARRSTADTIKLSLGVEVSNRVASIATFLLRIKETPKGFSLSTTKPSIEEIRDFLRDHKETIDQICAVSNNIRAGCIAALYHLSDRVNMEEVIQFARLINSRDGETNDPSFRIGMYLDRTQGSSGNQNLDLYKHSVTACIAYINCESITMLIPATSWDGLRKKGL